MYPERNSSLILRAEILSDGSPINTPSTLRNLSGFRAYRNLLRRLLPRQPQRDVPLDQDCSFYMEFAHEDVQEDKQACCLMILSPRLESGQQLPWYHPPVRHLAFRYVEGEHGSASIRIEIIPTEDSISAPTDPKSRLYRTCLALLETVYKYGKGFATGYKKRVVHDVCISK